MTSPEDTYDFVVVGSGFGGSVSAMRLTEKGYRVLVLERGKRREIGVQIREDQNTHYASRPFSFNIGFGLTMFLDSAAALSPRPNAIAINCVRYKTGMLFPSWFI